MSEFLFSQDTISAVLIAMAFAAVGTLLNHDDLSPYRWFRQLVSNATIGASWGLAVYGLWYMAVRYGYPLAQKPEVMWFVLIAGAISAPTVMTTIKHSIKERL